MTMVETEGVAVHRVTVESRTVRLMAVLLLALDECLRSELIEGGLGNCDEASFPPECLCVKVGLRGRTLLTDTVLAHGSPSRSPTARDVKYRNHQLSQITGLSTQLAKSKVNPRRVK